MRYLFALGTIVVAIFCGAAWFSHSFETALPTDIALSDTNRAETSSASRASASFSKEEDDSPSGKYDEDFSEGEDEENSISERRRYEIDRLADPATGQIPPDAHVREYAFVRTIPARERGAPGSKGNSTLQSFDWTSRGPTETGGRTRALAIDVSNERVMMAGSVSGGLWRSENGGLSWRSVEMPAGAQNISCIVQDTRPGKRNVWYIGTGELYTSFLGTGLYKSVDGGQTWRSLPATVPALSTRTAQITSPWSVVMRIALDPTKLNQDVVYAAVNGNIMRSSDGGDSWTSVLGSMAASFTNFAYYTDVAVSPGGTVYAALSELDFTFQFTRFAEQSGIWRSPNGTTWTNISPTPPTTQPPIRLPSDAQIARTVLAIVPTNDSLLYVLRDIRTSTVASGIQTALLRYTYLSGTGSGAGGGTWTDYTETFPVDFVSQNGYCMALKVKPDDPLFVIAGGVFAYNNPYNFRYRETTSRISNYATTTDYPPPPTQSWADHHDFVFLPSNPNVMYVANDGGIFRTENCTATSVRYASRSINYTTTQFYTIAIDHATVGDETIIGGLQDNGTRIVRRSDASGRIINLGDGTYCAISDSGRYYYASSQFANMNRFEFDQRGQRVNAISIAPTVSSFQRFFLDNPYQLDPNNQAVMYLAGGTSLWRNADVTTLNPAQLRAGWKNIATIGTDERITALSASVRPANVVYLGTSRGRVYRVENAHDSTTRVLRNITGSFPANGFVSCVVADPTNADWAIAAFSNYNVQSIFATTDGGTSWTPVGGNLEETISGVGGGPSVATVKIAYVGGKVWYFAGTSSGLFSTDRLNGMATQWIREGASTIGLADVRAIDVRPKDGFVAVATHGRGLFSTYLPTQPRRYDLSTQRLTVGQSYPNPAPRSEVTIPFFLPRSSRVVLTLWNALGQAVATPLEANLTAGEQFFLMPTSSIPAGMYVYRVEAGGEQAQGTMVVRP